MPESRKRIMSPNGREFNDENNSLIYYIMPRYGQNLEKLLKSAQYKVPLVSVYHMCHHLLNLLEVIHDADMVYNDLKFDNILLDYGEQLPKISQNTYTNCFQNVHLNLIDFGLASNWKNLKTGQHHEDEKVSYFKGNIYFASANKMMYRRPSRQDDLHSLVYLMIYIINEGNIPQLDQASKYEKFSDDKSLFRYLEGVL